MSDPQPICPRCGLYLVVRGCTAERCGNPEGAAELERLRAEEEARKIGPLLLDTSPQTLATRWYVANVDGKFCVYKDGVEVFQAAVELLRDVKEWGDRELREACDSTALAALLARIDGS